MAITITNQADLKKFVTSKDPILYEIETDDSPQRVKCEIFDEIGNVLATITHAPLFGETDLFTFDVHGIVDDLIGADMYQHATDITALTGFVDAPHSHLAFQCTFTEIFDDDSDSDSDSDAGASVTEDEVRVAIAAIFEPLNTDRMDDYNALSYFLTNFSRERKVRLTDSWYHMILFDTKLPQNDILHLRIDKVNKDLSTDNATIDYPFVIDSDGDANYSYTIHIGVGPQDINKALGSPFIDEDVDYYNFKVLDDSANTISDTRIYYVIEDCKPKSIQLHFLNRLGGFDQYNFVGQNVRSFETNSKEFQSNMVESKFAIGQDDVYKVHTGFLNENEALTLRELLSSPEVYMEVNTKYVKVIIETKKVKAIDSLNGYIKYEIDFHIAEKTKTQRR